MNEEETKLAIRIKEAMSKAIGEIENEVYISNKCAFCAFMSVTIACIVEQFPDVEERKNEWIRISEGLLKEGSILLK